MSRMTKHKYVAKEVLEDFVTPNENQLIVKVLAVQGNNLHKVETASRETYLVSMPTKFRKSIWIKRGDFLVVEPIEEGDKVKAEIIHILYKNQIRYLKQDGLWPKQFDDTPNSTHSVEKRDSTPSIKSNPSDGNSSESEEEDNDDDLFVNTNRISVPYDESSDSTENGDSDTDEEN